MDRHGRNPDRTASGRLPVPRSWHSVAGFCAAGPAPTSDLDRNSAAGERCGAQRQEGRAGQHERACEDRSGQGHKRCSFSSGTAVTGEARLSFPSNYGGAIRIRGNDQNVMRPRTGPRLRAFVPRPGDRPWRQRRNSRQSTGRRGRCRGWTSGSWRPCPVPRPAMRRGCGGSRRGSRQSCLRP